MITANGIEYRNLQEQVLKNKEDIAEIKDGLVFLNGIGITVLGQVDTVDNIPVETYNYGDTWLVGETAPYDAYVFTRANPGAGHESDYFLNIGNLAVVGPQGPKGEKGDTGDRGRYPLITFQTVSPQNPSNYHIGDIWVKTTTGDVWVLRNIAEYISPNPDPTGNYWNSAMNIRGPQGIQGLQGLQGPEGSKGDTGERGPQGDVGGFINIAGILPNIASLPSPTALHDLTVAYLVGASEPYTLYIQVGSTSEEAIWTDVGPLNVATLVQSGGVYQNIWDADTKLNANKDAVSSVGGLVLPSATPTEDELVGIGTNGAQKRIYIGTGLQLIGNTLHVDGETKLYRHSFFGVLGDVSLYAEVITKRTVEYDTFPQLLNEMGDGEAVVNFYGTYAPSDDGLIVGSLTLYSDGYSLAGVGSLATNKQYGEYYDDGEYEMQYFSDSVGEVI